MGLVPQALMAAGGFGHPGRSAAGRVEVESPLPLGTVIVPGTDFNYSQLHMTFLWWEALLILVVHLVKLLFQLT